jgi:hypothetical protein
VGILCFCGLTLAAGPGKYFQVEKLAPQYFKITPRVQGPVSSQLVGGGGSQELITRQENGRTVIYARIPAGAALTLRVGDFYLRLWMKTSGAFEVQEGLRGQEVSPTGPENL